MNITFQEYMAMLLFIAISGGQYFFILNGGIFVPLYLLLSLYINYRENHGLRFRSNSSTVFFVLSLLFMTIHYFFIYPNHVSNLFISIVLFFIGTYFFISAFSFPKFKYLYLNTLFVIATVSIIVYFLVENGIVSPVKYVKGENVSLLFFFHNVGWGNLFGRLAGIFWEPGAYQIVLNMTFLFYFRDIIDLNLSRLQIVKLFVIALALILTKSSAGYIVFAVIFGYFCYLKYRRDGVSLKMVILSIVSIFIVSLLFNSSVVQDKLLQEGSKGSSYEIRRADNLAMLSMIIEKPLIGYGLDSKERLTRSIFLDNTTSSNGTLSLLTNYGILFFIFYLYYLYKGIGKIYSRYDSIFIVSLFIFLTSFEVFWYFPIALTFLFSFKDN